MNIFKVILISGFSFDVIADHIDFNPDLNFNLRFLDENDVIFLSICAYSVAVVFDLDSNDVVFQQQCVYKYED